MGKNKDKDSDKVRRKWVISITLAAFFLSAFMNLFAELMLKNSTTLIAFIILILIILIGILFDIAGVAVTVADEKPFHSMASSRIKGARSSLMLIKNASRMSNLFNDVVGDTCGIISGSSAAFIVTQLGKTSMIDTAVLSIILSGFVASATIGGKAIGKELALLKSKEIIAIMGKVIAIFTEHKKK